MRHPITLAALAVLLLAGGPACAHAFLKTATPAVGSTLHQAPAAVTITFAEGVEPAFSTITVQDASGARVDDGKPHLAGDDTRRAVGLKTLTSGAYRVEWHATATDTHKTSGTFTFTVGP